MDQTVQQNWLDVINKVENQIFRENPDISEIVKSHPELENDPQARRFLEFVAIATNFASMKFVYRIRNVSELIASIKQLITQMIKEINDFADIARELQDLIHCFIKLVSNTKQNMELVVPPLQESINHMEVIADALSSNSVELLEKRDKEDIEIALRGMSSGIKKLLQLAQTSKKESNDLDEKVATMESNIHKKKSVIQGRLELAEVAAWDAIGVGAVGGITTAGAAVGVGAFGGAGALVIGSAVIPPIFAIIAAALIGGVVVGGIVYLVKTLWARQNIKALNYLNKIFDLLVKLSDANLHFSNYMNKAEIGASKILSETSQIQQTITTGSERYRKINVRICAEAIQSTKDMITCIDDIIKVDMSQWINSSAVLDYAKSSNVVSATEAIEN